MSHDPFATPEQPRPEPQAPPAAWGWQPLASPVEPVHGAPGGAAVSSGAPGYPAPTPYTAPGQYVSPARYPGPAPSQTAAPYGAPLYGVPQYGAVQFGPPQYGINGDIRAPYRGMAIASFVTAVVGVVLVLIPIIALILAILGVVFGHVSLTQFRRDPQPRPGRGLAVAGLVIGYVGVVASLVVWVAFAAAYA